MESIIVGVDWTGVLLGTVLAFGLGWLWYSEAVFGKKWRAGLGSGGVMESRMVMSMVAQVVATFLLAWMIGVTRVHDDIWLAVLVTLMLVAMIKTNGFFSGKTKTTIAIETGYIVVMVVIMLLVQMIL